MRSVHVYAAADALRTANAMQETGSLSDPEDAARVVIVAFLESARKDPRLAQFHGAQAGVIDALQTLALQP